MKLLGRRCRKIHDNDNVFNINASSENEIPEEKKEPDEQRSNEDLNLCISWRDVSLVIDRVFFCSSSFAIVSSFIIFTYFVVSSKKECV